MIPRYSRAEMTDIWSPETKFRIWFEIEAHAADAMAELGVIPKDAARIFEQMDVPILVTLVERMREAKAAPILAELTPLRAKQIAGELAKRRQPTAGG